MKRFLAAMLAAIVVSGPHAVAADDAPVPPPAPGSGPFELIPLPPPRPRTHLGATLAFLSGAGLIASSFTLAHRADDAYARYLAAKSPADIEYWFDRSTRLDRWSSGALLSGEVLVGTGVYLRFLRRPASPLSLLVASRSCAVSLRF